MNFNQQSLVVAIALATLAAGHAHSRAVLGRAVATAPAALRPWARPDTPWPQGIALATSSRHPRY